MSRLTERFGQNATTKEPCYIPAGIGKQEGNPLNEIINKLGRLEDLADEGRLIELPCKMGTPIWWVTWDYSECFVKEYYVEESTFDLDDLVPFGTFCFLTKAEAEEALKRLQENEKKL